VSQHKQPSLGFWASIVAAALVPVVIYVGAYLALVRAEAVTFLTGPVFRLPDGRREPSGFPKVAHYRWPLSERGIEGGFVSTLFGPVHDLDRKMRIEMWAPEPIEWGSP